MAKDDLNEVCNVLITARDMTTGKIIAEKLVTTFGQIQAESIVVPKDI